MPSLNSADFTCTFPSASNELPLRAAFLDAMEEKLTIPEVRDEWMKVVQQHNAALNTEGNAYRAEGESSGQQQQRLQAPTSASQTLSNCFLQKVSRLGKPSLEECNHCQDLGTWSCKNVTFQNLACQVLKEICKISDLWQPSLDKYFHLCSCLGRPSHERHNSILT